ncbi:hypothetical protein OAH16_01175 [bacterium]|nr:hypothetical protein [bacterium]
MKHLLLTTIAAVLLVGCGSLVKDTGSAEEEAKKVLIDFFDNLDFQNYQRRSFNKIITEDFHIYEIGKHMSRDEFFDFVENNHSSSSVVSQDWTLSDFQISTVNETAHIAYRNEGTFISKNKLGVESVLKINWLESAYFVKENGLLKIKFLHSQEINKELKAEGE